MLNSKGERELAYVVKIDNIEPITGSDNCEAAVVGGWRVMTRKGTFQPGDLAIYFEIDSQVPATEQFAFLEKKHYKVKTQKYTFGGKGNFVSQGLLMHPNDFGWTLAEDADGYKIINWGDKATDAMPYLSEGDFLTQELEVTYAEAEDNKRKANSTDKYKKMAQRHPKLFQNPIIKKIYKTNFGKKVLFLFFGKKKDKKGGWPVGRFPGVSKTDQERCENMIWVLSDKTPFIVTQKCDGTSGTFILERKGKKKFEFYVCSRNVRMESPAQECFYGNNNYYWDAAIKYDIENKMKQYLLMHPHITFVCWQGEICGPGIQKNPQSLSELHLFCFHWTDSLNGRMDIREAKKYWDAFNMETVPIVSEDYIMPDDFEDFKKTADGYYDPSVCEGNTECPREGFVYYKTTEPTFSFKNVSREYLLKH